MLGNEKNFRYELQKRVYLLGYLIPRSRLFRLAGTALSVLLLSLIGFSHVFSQIQPTALISKGTDG